METQTSYNAYFVENTGILVRLKNILEHSMY